MRRSLLALIAALAVSSDGRYLASSDASGLAVLWSTKDWSSTRLAGHQDTVSNLAFAPNDRWLVTVSGDGTARLWDLETHHAAVLLHGAKVRDVAFLGGSTEFVTCAYDGVLRIWRAERIAALPASPPERWSTATVDIDQPLVSKELDRICN